MRARSNVRIVVRTETKPTRKEPRKLSVFGLDFSNWASFVALLLALLGFFGTQVDNFLVHPVPRMIAPTALNFYCSPDYQCQPGSKTLVRVGPIGFVDDVASGHAYLVTGMKVAVELVSKDGSVLRSFEMPWYYFTDATQSGDPETSVGPFRVAPDSPTGKEVEFQPYRNSTPADQQWQLSYVDFLNLIEQGDVDRIRVTVTASTYRDGSVAASCTAKVDATLITDAQRNKALLGRDCT